MGCFDWVTFEAGHAEAGIAPGERFQTKSLEGSSLEFRVSHEGTLILREHRFEPDAVGANRLKSGLTRVFAGDVEVPYHGDLLLIGWRRGKDEFVARFTHGVIEWVKPLASYPERWAHFLLRCDGG